MQMTATQLRANLYKVLDKVVDTGMTIEIERNGHVIKISCEQPKSKLANLIKHPGTIIGDPDELVHIDWSDKWNENKNL